MNKNMIMSAILLTLTMSYNCFSENAYDKLKNVENQGTDKIKQFCKWAGGTGLFEGRNATGNSATKKALQTALKSGVKVPGADSKFEETCKNGDGVACKCYLRSAINNLCEKSGTAKPFKDEKGQCN